MDTRMPAPAVNMLANQIADRLNTLPITAGRRLVGIAGPPASGKSTLVSSLVPALAGLGYTPQVVPMDGFHLENTVLERRGLLDRKGSPDTFDVARFVDLVSRLRHDPRVDFPTFDRANDCTVAHAGKVRPECDLVLVEGNYLLLDAPIWRDLHAHWDISVLLKTDPAELRRRLIERWRDNGMSIAAATARAEENDLKNLETILHGSIAADMAFETNA